MPLQLDQEYGSIVVNSDVTVAPTGASTDMSINGSGVTKKDYRRVILDPDAGANPDMKVKLSKGKWRVSCAGAAISAGNSIEVHLYKTESGGTAAELDDYRVPLGSGGDNFAFDAIVDVLTDSADVELMVSNETDTDDITVERGTTMLVQGLRTQNPRLAV